MKLGLTLLSCAAFYTIIQDFLYGVNATINDGGLALNSNEVLEVNTTAPSVNCSSSCNYNASHENRSSSNYTFPIAVIKFAGDITFKSGSIVKVVGEYALSIVSLNGSIDIQTDINMTCRENVHNKTCLGGFTQSAEGGFVDDSEEALVYRGLGPGGLLTPNDRIGQVSGKCLSGSNHGGKGHQEEKLKAGPPYDKQNMTSLLGGSGGSCFESPGSAAGGGAIELVAEEGKIVINASIRASAQVPANHLSNCSGGSGGLIRLKANKVEIKEIGKLIVDGGNAHQPRKTYFLGGGGGGIIQIIAPQGSLANDTLSLKHGSRSNHCGKDATNGYFLLKGNETASPIFNGSAAPWPSSFYSWPPTSSNSGAVTTTHSSATPAGNTDNILNKTASPTSSTTTQFLFPTATTSFGSSMTTKTSYTSPTVTPRHSSVSPTTGNILATSAVLTLGPTTEDQVNQLKKDVKSIEISIKNGDGANISEISEVLTSHQSLAGSLILNTSIMDLCLKIFKGYQAIVDWVAKKYPDALEETLRNISETGSRCLRKVNHAVWKRTRNMPNLMQSLEDILATVVNSSYPPEINYTIWTQNGVAAVVKKGVDSLTEDIRAPNYLDIEDNSWKGVSDFVFIPKETVMNAKGENYSYIFVLYKDVEDGLPNKSNNGNEGDYLNVSSFVMSCFLKLDEKPVYYLSPPALLTFKTSSSEELERQCSYWNLKESKWSTDGVRELKPDSSSTHTVCQADHFTSFAILMQHRKIPPSKEHILALSIITYIGCGISTAALIITLIIFLSIESLSSERHKIHTNLVVALLLAHVLFLAGIKETSNQVLCEIIAVFLHYFFLTAFTWMLVEGLHLYLKVVQVFRTENIKMAYYYVFGWCFSIIPVVITLSMKPNSYGNSEVCWLSTEDGTIWAFIGPVIAIIAINCFVLFMVVKTVVSSASAVKSTDHEHVKAGIKGLFVLMPILGVGWVLGLFALNKGTIVFVYAFAIVNGFQGLLIFLLHCVFNTEVRQAFRRQREKHALSRENDSQYNASFSLSPSEASGSKRFSNFNSFEKLKATNPLKRKSTSKVVKVQPVSDSRDVAESSLQVKRAFQHKSTSKLSVTNVQNETSFLNCPMESEESVPPLIAHSKKQEKTNRNRQTRH